MKLLLNGLTKFLIGLLLVGVLIFLPAGTFNYIGGWVFVALLFIPMLIMGVVMFIKAPDLLKKRLQSKEKEGTQKGVVAVTALIFLSGFIVAGLDFRFSWLPLPSPVIIAASVVFIAAYILYAEVLRENTYLSRTIEVQAGQKVVDTGLYAIVRHPMYSAVILLFLSMPLVLGSVWAFFIFLPFPALLAVRIKNEEAVLLAGLEGYREYTQRVRWRLIPYIW